MPEPQQKKTWHYLSRWSWSCTWGGQNNTSNTISGTKP